MDNRFVAIMLGPPGAGKGTQAVRVAERFQVPHISTGDILRDNVARETELGLKARSFMEGGDLVPDELIIELIADRIEHDDATSGFLLDGFPRTLAQAVSLEDLLREREMPIDVVTLLDVQDDEIVRRISSRYLCRECKRDANAGQGTISDICPHCGGELYQREDDTAETVQNRLEVYRRQTAPLVEYYEGKNLLLKVDGVGNVDEISIRLFASLEREQDPEAG
ncbi:adenylate kinase [Gemmatimonadota bacterium]